MRSARKTDNLATIYEPNVWKGGNLTPHKPKGLHGLYRENFTLPLMYTVINSSKTDESHIF
jgi:hypothetical protein